METIPVFFLFVYFFSVYFWTGIGREATWSPSRSPGGQTLYSMECTDPTLGIKKEATRGSRGKNKTEIQALKWKFCWTYSPRLETISSWVFFSSFSQFSFMEQHFSSSLAVTVSFLTFLSKESPRKWMPFYLWQQWNLILPFYIEFVNMPCGNSEMNE